MQCSEQRLAANRLNATKSTGPRTARGRLRSSRNASTHGIFCRDLVLAGESMRFFKAFRRAMLLRLRPRDAVELMLCDRVVAASWRLRRLQAAEGEIHLAHAHQLRELQHRHREFERCDADEDAYRECIDELGFVAVRQIPVPDTQDKAAAVIKAIELPARTILASLVYRGHDNVLERMSRYEQRLEYTIHRSLRELQKLRTKIKETAQDPVSCEAIFVPVKRIAKARPERSSNTQNEPIAKNAVPATPAGGKRASGRRRAT